MAGPTWTKACERCGTIIERYRGESDISCECGAWYNAGGQRLRDDWMDNPSFKYGDVDDLTGFEQQHHDDH